MSFFRIIHLTTSEMSKYHIGKSGIKFSLGDKTFFKNWNSLAEEGFKGLTMGPHKNWYPEEIHPQYIKDYLEERFV